MTEHQVRAWLWEKNVGLVSRNLRTINQHECNATYRHSRLLILIRYQESGLTPMSSGKKSCSSLELYSSSREPCGQICCMTCATSLSKQCLYVARSPRPVLDIILDPILTTNFSKSSFILLHLTVGFPCGCFPNCYCEVHFQIHSWHNFLLMKAPIINHMASSQHDVTYFEPFVTTQACELVQ